MHAAAGVAPQVTERFYEVMHLLKAPTALFTPAILWKLVTRRRVRADAGRAMNPARVAQLRP